MITRVIHSLQDVMLPARARPPVLPPPCSVRPPHSHRSLSRVCVPAARSRPSSSRQASPVRRSAVRRCTHWPARPLAVWLSTCRPRRARPLTRTRLPPGPQPAPVNLAVTGTAPALAPTALPTRPPPDRPHRACACVPPVTRHSSIGTACTWRLCHVTASSTWVPTVLRHARYIRCACP